LCQGERNVQCFGLIFWFWFTWHVEWSASLCSRLVVSFLYPAFWLVLFPGFWLANRPEMATSDWSDYILKRQKLLTLREAHEFTRCVTRSLVWCVCFVDRCLSFVLFLLAIVLSILLQYTDSDYPFDYLQTLLHTRCLVGSVLLIYLVFLLCGVPNVGSVSWLPLLVFITFL
jgi:hypothetical protein